MSSPVNWTVWTTTYDRHWVVKHDHPSVVPPDEISGRFTGAGLTLAPLLWVMACVESTTAVTTAASIPGWCAVGAAREWAFHCLHEVGGCLTNSTS